MRELGVTTHADYRVSVLMDHKSMVTVRTEKYGACLCLLGGLHIDGTDPFSCFSKYTQDRCCLHGDKVTKQLSSEHDPCCPSGNAHA